ncbi:basic leucine zipper 34-like [Senna tora]|uniref:Basic leucine zipper 34-like n=1 Tax=Senna tora TaxID=362788 RepID=A0A834WW00_9FABA|nr:basic leucine zipper 34-like [Senna tora]
MGDTKKREFENFVGGSSHDAGNSDDNKFRKIDQDIERQFREGRNFYPDMDPKNLKEMIARQSSSQGSNQKKAPNVAELEMEVKALKTRIGFIYSQIEAYENKSLSLLIENQAIKLQLVAEEKRRLLQEGMGDTKKREFENFVGGSSHGDGDGDDNKIRKIDQDIERQFLEGHKFYPNMDPKNLKEMIARQSSSQRSPNVAELEMEVKALKSRIGFIYSQIEAYENKSLSLLIENQAIKLQLVAEEKRRLLQEDRLV